MLNNYKIIDELDKLFIYVSSIEQLQDKIQSNKKALKKDLVDVAIQGKLTKQLPEDGTAEELYQQIQEEKRKLEAKGRIKKEKKLPSVTEDEIPFDTPDNWKWVRCSDIMMSISTGPFGSMLHKNDYIIDGIPLINPANIIDERIIPSEKMMISQETKERLSSYVLNAGMIVMGRRGEMGRCAIITENEDGWVCGTGSFFMEPAEQVYPAYLLKLFSSQYAKKYLSGASVGTTMNNLNLNILNGLPIPLPPLAEQKRIVAKLEELLPLCE